MVQELIANHFKRADGEIQHSNENENKLSLEMLKMTVSKIQSEGASVHTRIWKALVVDISIPPPSFQPVSLFFVTYLLLF